MKLIKGGALVYTNGTRKADILIEGEKIVKIGLDIECQDGCKLIDANNKLVFPGFIDAHTHFDLHVAGTVTADDFASGTAASAVGGTTTVIDFATAYPGESLKEGLDNWHKKASKGCSCDYGFHQTITSWNKSISDECQDMVDAGVTSFKIYMTYDTKLDDKTITEVLLRLRETGAIAGCHCENSGIIDALRNIYASDNRKGLVSSHYKTRPAAAEAEAIGRFLHISEVADTPAIDVHLTCEEGLEEIRAARKRGQKVYVETCPQYLLLDSELYNLPGFEGAAYVCAPPLRSKSDNTALWKALNDGEIQTVSTDHCAFTLAQKALGKDDFRKIPGGLPGAQTRGITVFSEGVAKGRITLEKMCEVLCENPARLYGLYPRKGVLRPGSDADITIIDPEAKTKISAKNQISKSDYSPFEGREFSGCIDSVYLRGELIAGKNKLIKENTGEFLRRGRNTL